LPTQRLGSAALFGFRAAALVTLVGCGAESEDSAATSKDNEKAPLSTAQSATAATQAPPVESTAVGATAAETPPSAPPSGPTIDLPTPGAPTEVAPELTDTTDTPTLEDAGTPPPPTDDIRNPVSIYRAPPSD
jgi:hypothetical protein